MEKKMDGDRNHIDLGRKIATLTEKVSNLEKQFPAFKKELTKEVNDLLNKYESLDKQLRGRPSWAVCIIISILFGTCTTLATVLAMVTAL